jgi:hypothetical protein
MSNTPRLNHQFLKLMLVAKVCNGHSDDAGKACVMPCNCRAQQ